mgnify:FL=1
MPSKRSGFAGAEAVVEEKAHEERIAAGLRVAGLGCFEGGGVFVGEEDGGGFFVAAPGLGMGVGDGEVGNGRYFLNLLITQYTCFMCQPCVAAEGGEADVDGGGGEGLGELVIDERLEVNGRYLTPTGWFMEKLCS